MIKVKKFIVFLIFPDTAYALLIASGDYIPIVNGQSRS